MKAAKLSRGEVRVRQNDNLVVTLWKDKKDVIVLSSNCDPAEQVVAVRGQQLESLKPEVVRLYNNYMG